MCSTLLFVFVLCDLFSLSHFVSSHSCFVTFCAAKDMPSFAFVRVCAFASPLYTIRALRYVALKTICCLSHKVTKIGVFRVGQKDNDNTRSCP